LLQRVREMSIEELRALYANMKDGDREELSSENESATAAHDDASQEATLALLDEDDHEEKDEFYADMEEMDDETTIEAEERLGRDMSYQDEIDLLKKESEMSIEELRAMYADIGDDSNEEEKSGITVGDMAEEVETTEMTADEDSERRPSSVADSHTKNSSAQNDLMTETDEVGAILASPDKVPMLTRPFLLASWVKLREYQHIGLSWLVSIQSRRLNGILAEYVLVVFLFFITSTAAIKIPTWIDVRGCGRSILINACLIYDSSFALIKVKWGWGKLYRQSPCLLTLLPTREFGDLI
jgi:hypothetical protein